MKNIIAFILFIAFSTYNFGQNFVVESPTLGYEFVGARSRPVTKETLQSAKSLLDINEGFPAKWISKYKSVTVSTTIKGVEKSATSENITFNDEQKDLLSQAQFGDEIRTSVVYDIENATTKNTQEETMVFSVSLAPATQAEFLGGKEKREAYMTENGFGLLRSKKVSLNVALKFTIDKDGAVKNPYFVKTSGKEDVDSLLLNLISKMPKWNPAKTSTGEPIEQAFELVVNSFLGC